MSVCVCVFKMCVETHFWSILLLFILWSSINLLLCANGGFSSLFLHLFGRTIVWPRSAFILVMLLMLVKSWKRRPIIINFQYFVFIMKLVRIKNKAKKKKKWWWPTLPGRLLVAQQVTAELWIKAIESNKFQQKQTFQRRIVFVFLFLLWAISARCVQLTCVGWLKWTVHSNLQLLFI